ncbi:hypothetical protein MTX78_09220 [Hymenobacter tibetensis]|uniref:DNA-directed DNA polymerase family A palm domain-containing protein n=1 Tax=Hymenobacter tibetensis TaxID=497967 RepID=A0ABY4D2M0_9BACT|nr:hypothetical protein [Hymenobacter tibetensis]UOG76765.1 hypothetical protein MTX78_09220 [Hymenobacter tibetensis]
MIQEQFAVQSKIDIVQLLDSIGETDRYINDHIDKYHYILHCINEAGVFDRQTDDGYANLSSVTLREFLGKRYADRIVKELLAWGVIECDGKAAEGYKCYGYRIHPSHISKTVLVKVRNEKMVRKLRIQRATYQQQHQHDPRWKNLTQLTIRYQDALAHIDTKRETALAVTQPDQYAERKEIEDLYTMELESIRKLSVGDFFLEQPDPASRVYTNLSNLSTDLRQFLVFRKTKNTLVNLDIANSQPYLFSLLLMQHYHSQDIPADVQKYIELTSAGRFYEFLMEALNVPLSERKAFKPDFFGKVFYCSSYYSKRTPEGKYFQEAFPNVGVVVDYYKELGKQHYEKKAYKHLSITMQRQEAQIILRTIGTDLQKKKIWYSTIHDSVVVLEEHAETVKTLILDAFRAAVGVPPKVKPELLTNSK